MHISNRRQFLKTTALGAVGFYCSHCSRPSRRRPNILFVFADQWRACDTGYAGNPDVHTPNIDRFAAQSINFTNAVSGCSVCCPYRASLMTGQYALTHGVIYNDKPLNPAANTMGKIFAAAGYDTAYIGKWHLNGHDKTTPSRIARKAYIPKERRQGFEYWKALECTHDYNNSMYYDDDPEPKQWDGYDAIAQTRDARQYIKNHDPAKPFLMVLSWGPPHAPYHTAPEVYQEMVAPAELLTIRKNVPDKRLQQAHRDYRGYYAHMAALDACFHDLLQTLEETGLADDTIVVFTSDHGDMLYSHNQTKKQKPWDESIRVPFLLRDPRLPQIAGKQITRPINTPDILPTLLRLAGLTIPDSVEGDDFAPLIRGIEADADMPALIMCPVPFHQWNYKRGGREYRGVRTIRYTYVRDLNGPWLLYDNEADPFQLNNLCNTSKYAEIQQKLDKQLQELLAKRGDQFLPGPEYMKCWDYEWDGTDAPAV